MADSILLGIALRLIKYFKDVLVESVAYKLFCRIYDWFVNDIRSSKLVRFLYKDEKVSFYVKYSAVLGKIQDMLSGFSAWSRKLYEQRKDVLMESIFFKIVLFLSKDIVLLLGLSICLQMIIPESKWHNVYNVVFIAVVVLVYLVKVTTDIRFNINLNKIDISVLVFVASIFLAVINSNFSVDSLKYVAFYISIFLFGFILVNSIRNKYAFIKFIKIIIVMSVLLCIYGVIQYILGIPVDPLLVDINMGQMLSRVYSTLGNPNVYAGVLVLVLPYYMLLFLEVSKVREKVLTVLMGVVLMCNIALTYSRTAYIAAIVVIVSFLILKNKKMLPLIVLGILVAIPLVPSNVIERLLTLGKDSSSIYRFDIWESSFRMAKENWFLGIGINVDNFRVMFTKYSHYSPPMHTHMFLLQIWLELGLIGVLSMFWMVLRLVKWALKILIEGTDKKMNNVIIANISALGGILLFGLAENIGFSLRLLYMFWIVVMLLIVSLNISGKQYKKLDMQIIE